MRVGRSVDGGEGAGLSRVATIAAAIRQSAAAVLRRTHVRAGDSTEKMKISRNIANFGSETICTKFSGESQKILPQVAPQTRRYKTRVAQFSKIILYTH